MNELTDPLAAVEDWYKESAPGLLRDGYVVELSARVEGRPKPAVSIMIESSTRLAKLTCWSTGETEIELGDVVTDRVLHEHRQIGDRAGLADAARVVLAWVGGRRR